MEGWQEELARCRREVERLSEENAILRCSSEAFAALAQRLNDVLIIERQKRAQAAKPKDHH